MSSVVVTTRTVDDVKPHPNADRLDLAIVGGWQTVVPKGAYAVGQLVTFVPPDCLVPPEVSDRWGVTKYLSNGRVRAVRLRGEPSYGFVVPPEGEPGRNVAESLGITKYQPPMKFSVGDAEPTHPLFCEYTDVENLRHYGDVIQPGEMVTYTEKIHGTNSRIGIIKTPDGDIRVSGSRTMQRKHAENSVYWFPWTVPGVTELLERLSESAKIHVLLFGEVYGKVQSLRYGKPNGLAYAAFDIMVDGRYLSPSEFAEATKDIPTAPVIRASVPFDAAEAASLSKGRSLVFGADHIREGVVVRPDVPRTDPKIGRVILKYVSDDYLCGDFDAASE